MDVDSLFPGGGDPGSTAASVVAGAKTLDPDAWQRLAALYGPLVYTWARRAGLRGEDAADVTQDVFRTVLTTVGRLRNDRPGDTFRGWLWTITRSRLRDFWRRADGRPAAAGGSDALDQLLLVPDPGPANDLPPADCAGELLRRAAELVRAEFEDRSWQAFWRVTVDGRPAAEVGRELGMTANAVYVARSRILRRLREVLEKDGGAPGEEPPAGARLSSD